MATDFKIDVPSDSEDVFPFESRDNDNALLGWCYSVHSFIYNHWRGIVCLTVPIGCFPLILIPGEQLGYKCLYCLLVMISFWMTEAIPSPVTSLIPVVLFPLLGILTAEEVASKYFSEGCVMFIASCITALSFAYCGLHKRFARTLLALCGYNIKLLHLVMMTITMVSTALLSNVCVVAIMCPVTHALLEILKNKKVIRRTPPGTHSSIGIAFFVGTAFVATAGSNASLLGSPTGNQCKNAFERVYGKHEELNINNLNFSMYSIPTALLTSISTIIYFQMFYLGFAQPRRLTLIRELQSSQFFIGDPKISYKRMRPMTYNQIMVIILFLLVILSYFTRSGDIGQWGGWSGALGYDSDWIQDSAPTVAVVCLYFMIPANLSFFRYFYKSKKPLPTREVPSLVDWDFLRDNLPWGTCFVIGGAMAIDSGVQKSHVVEMVTQGIDKLGMSKEILLLIIVVVEMVLVQFISDITVVTLFLKLVETTADEFKIQPLYFILPTALTSSSGYLLPISSITNLITIGLAGIKPKDILVTGVVPFFMSTVFIFLTGVGWSYVIYPSIGTEYIR